MVDDRSKCEGCQKPLAAQCRSGVCVKCSKSGAYKLTCSGCGARKRVGLLKSHRCNGNCFSCGRSLAKNNITGICNVCQRSAAPGSRVTCPECNNPVHPNYLRTHIKTCPGIRVCTNCGSRIQRRVGTGFCSPKCYATMPMVCPNGCSDLVPKRHMSRHIRDCDGYGTKCRFNSDHNDFQSQGHRKQHEFNCPDDPDHAAALPFHGTKWRKKQLAKRDGPGCVACGSTESKLAEDHCFAQNLMNSFDPDNDLDWVDGLWNLELLCQFSCNLSKRDKIWPDQAERAIARFVAEHGYTPEVLIDAASDAPTWNLNKLPV